MLATYPDSMEAQQAKEMLAFTPPVDTQKKTEIVESKPSTASRVTQDRSSTETSGPHYSIQIGAFSSKKVADDMAKGLERKGYFVSVIDASSRSKSLYKVRVGKYKSESEANRAAQELKSKEGLPTLLVYE